MLLSINKACKRTLFIFIFLTTQVIRAEVTNCPSPMEVKERQISQQFDWTVAEDVTLHSLLNVRRLYFVSIENHGEFLACSYDSETLQIRLDGKPIQSGCLIKPQSEQWFSSEPGMNVCLESDKSQCKVFVKC